MTESLAPAGFLPQGVVVLERGWLSSNSVVVHGAGNAAIVDTGYASHALQTVQLVRSTLGDAPLSLIVNTHLHSDHCGGNAALQAAYPGSVTMIPPGLAAAVASWEEQALTYAPTGQTCPRFGFQGLLTPGSEIALGDLRWEIHAAPGHDPHSVVLFEPRSRCLISADALWENGFGVVFPELEGDRAFHEVGQTLDLIEDLDPRCVIPGHGSVFTDIEGALQRARSRLAAYVASPARHAAHAAKVLLKFKLLDLQDVGKAQFLAWADGTPYFRLVHDRWFAQLSQRAWVEQLIRELAASGAARLEAERIING